jgi:hypothetical protein
MSEQEMIFLISVTVIMPIVALWIIVGYQKSRLKIKQNQPDRSLTTTELEDMIQESVSAATAPLHDRIEQLEHRISETGQSAPEAGPMQVEGDLAAGDVEQPAKTLGRARS